MSFSQQRVLRSPTGAELNVYVKRAEGRPRAVVQINHGLAEHAARYVRFATFLGERGFHVYAHDHRGHGATKAPDAPLGRFAQTDGGANVIADVAAVHDLIACDHPGLPVIVFGHSMGGLVALNFMLHHSSRLHAAAIWNANFSAGLASRVARIILAWEKFRLGSDMPSRMLPRLTFQAWGKAVPDHRTPFDWLSRDAAEVDKYIADPLCGWDASVSMWRDLFGFVFDGADDTNFSGVRKTLPICLVGGEKDPATDGGKAVSHLAGRLHRMGFSNLVSKVYAETRHESLNDVNRDKIMDDFAAWADSVLKQP
ncbi:alpha/beta hydrolase [Mesorhizobium sp.]|uniref:alpha/beta fold hydrolase n=1 Tax=Mesorhizobium sp. TaxID=1871066 RepID=UPI000FE8F8FE|nr:alpha/beta hydrolase [Mesorhizobium sp.]RWB30496.1 MAG: alpha/beta hydrolase [Mesorhizobium sp.]RWD39356.1 MAG: alpha/beta hydrolase [Mesorhizobium sp.]RWD44258.1 MAG: alpha/beta hydrolase [Mesorhizobium sp.]RWD78001.1 MAG: alpha/beta hydrolase [Mesorhizobium sp.]RWE67998.1 MAG: alpha/beta hydrolase [Mesorhizobium sp.]